MPQKYELLNPVSKHVFSSFSYIWPSGRHLYIRGAVTLDSCPSRSLILAKSDVFPLSEAFGIVFDKVSRWVGGVGGLDEVGRAAGESGQPLTPCDN